MVGQSACCHIACRVITMDPGRTDRGTDDETNLQAVVVSFVSTQHAITDSSNRKTSIQISDRLTALADWFSAPSPLRDRFPRLSSTTLQRSIQSHRSSSTSQTDGTRVAYTAASYRRRSGGVATRSISRHLGWHNHLYVDRG